MKPKTVYLVTSPELTARLRFLIDTDQVTLLEHGSIPSTNDANIQEADIIITDTFAFLDEYKIGDKPVFLVHDGKHAGASSVTIVDINDHNDAIRRALGFTEAAA